jgi:RNA polymerase sigma-70 factor (ECF subfamily)
VDCEDVLQEAYLLISKRVPDFIAQPTVPFFIWARQITLQVLIDLHRRHLGAVMRDVKLEVSLPFLARAQGSSSAVVMEFAGDLTSPSEVAVRNEVAAELRGALQRMSENDREILMLRHLEELTNKEVAQVLGLDKSAASRRYMRALERLKAAFALSANDG